MRRKIIVTYVLLCASVFALQAQQTPLYSLYMMNDFAVNPAIAGVNNHFKAQFNNRYMFVGLEGAPSTMSINSHGRLSSFPMGVGGLLYSDNQGAFSKVGVYGAFSYIIPAGTFGELSLGFNVGVIDYKVDLSKVSFLEDEYGINEQMYKFIKPDATFGAYYNHPDYYFGASIDQLFNNNFEFITSDTLNMINKLTSHLTLAAGYKMKMSYGFEFEPSVVIRKVANAPLQLEVCTRLIYAKTAWAGISMRSGDAVNLLLGYDYRRLLSFAYAYDITYSKLRLGSKGSHEIMMSIKFNEK